MVETGLVLQGGGALGAYELGAVKRLYEEPGFRPTVVSGVSIGAITAAVLVGARDDPVSALEALWRKFTVPSSPLVPRTTQRYLALFGNWSFFRMRSDYVNGATWTSFYDTSPLRSTLQEFIDFEKIRRSEVKLFVTATNVSTGAIEIFENRDITPDHVVASGALPPGFPMVKINHDYYWDGGVFDNSPLGPVIECMNTDPRVAREIVVINLFPGRGPIPENMFDVLDRALQITFSNKFRSDIKQAQKVNEYIEVIRAIDAVLPANDAIRRLPGYRRLTQYSLVDDVIYIENGNPEIVFAPFDFSRNSIEARIDAGYRDAGVVLGALPARALPKGLLRASN